MTGLYFSGTGNTKHCVELFLRTVDESALAIPLESAGAAGTVSGQEIIVLAYPTYYSNIPYIVREYMGREKSVLHNDHGAFFR